MPKTVSFLGSLIYSWVHLDILLKNHFLLLSKIDAHYSRKLDKVAGKNEEKDNAG